MPAASLQQLDYITALAGLARVEVDLDDITWSSEVSKMIESLQKQVEITVDMRKCVFAELRKTKHTKADMYAAVGCTRISASGDATEFQGRQAIRRLRGELVGTRRVAAAEPEPPKRPAMRPRLRPIVVPREQPGPDVTVRELPDVQVQEPPMPRARRVPPPRRLLGLRDPLRDAVLAQFPHARIVRMGEIQCSA